MNWLWSWEWFPANLCVWILSVIVVLGAIWLIITIIKEIIDELIGQLWMGYIMIDLDKDIELYKSKVAFYESQNTRGEYAVTVQELKFVVETLEALRSERSQGDLISREALKAKMFDIPKPKEGATFWDGVDTVGDLIDKAPLVPLPDFKAGYKQAIIDGKTNFPRPKGEWIELPKAFDNRELPCKCSLCGHILSFMNYYPKSNFCPDCGADMREIVQND